MEIFLLIVCLLLAAVSLYLFITRTGLVTAKIIAEKSFADLVQRFKESELRRDKSEKQILDLTTNLSRLETEKASLTEALENRKKDIEETKKQFKDEFENLAHKIFETSRVSLTKENTKQVDDLLKPLREKLGDFQKKVEDTHLKDIEKSAELKTEIRKLTEMNQTLSLDAKNLTKALKGESKTQGNWWELILEDLLERSWLEKGREYILQGEGLGLKSPQWTPLKPDVVIRLPESRSIIIDAKVSLTDYERFVSSEEESEREVHLSQHIGSIRAHIDELAKKDYASLPELKSPDFVMMFVPIEASLSVALIKDTNLFAYAWEKGVVLVSPTTLLMGLKTIATLWRHEKQTKNVQEIAKAWGLLYDKFVGFLEDMDAIKKSLEKAIDNHGNAMNKLKTGKGNLLTKVEELKKLGAKTQKSIEGGEDVSVLESVLIEN